MSQSRELWSQRSHNNPHQSYGCRTTCNPPHLTHSRKWARTQFPYQSLPKLTNLNLTPFRLYQKTRISTPCPTHTHGIPMVSTQNLTFVPSYPHGRPTIKHSDSLPLTSMLLKSRNLHCPSMDLPLNGILATTRGTLRRSRTSTLNSSNFSIVKSRSENCFGSSTT